MPLYQKLIVFFVPLVFAIKIIYDTRGICFFAGHNRTDSEKMIRAASEIRFWDWPSKMHSISYGRAHMREYWVLALKVIKSFFKNEKSEHVSTVLSICTNYISSVLLYFILANYFNPDIAFIITLLYITSFWPYEVHLYLGHIHLAQMFILLAIYCIQSAKASTFMFQVVFFFLSGIFMAVGFASSSASRKYLPLVLAAFLYALRNYLSIPWHRPSALTNQNYWLLVGIVILGAITLRIVLQYNIKQIAALVKKILKKDRPPERYANFIFEFFKISFWAIILIAIFCIFFIKDNHFYIYATVFGLGILLVALHILLPFSDLIANIGRYNYWLSNSKWGSYFPLYEKEGISKKTFGKDIPKNFRRAGLPWIPRFLWRITPVILILYVISVIGVGVYQILGVIQGKQLIISAIGGYLFFIVISLMPIIVVEVTKGFQACKSYMPSLIALLFMIAVFLQITWNFAKKNEDLLFLWWCMQGGIVLFQFILSAFIYFTDLLPARMAPCRLRDVLHKFNVKEFYTYKNPYNDVLVDTMLYTYPNEFKVNYIKSISDVAGAIIVIPGTSSKSVHMEADKYGREHGDFTDDQALNKLYTNHMVERLALAKIRTMGCSKIYVLEGSITGYRDLILKQTTDHDRWLGNAWVLEASSLKRV